MLSSGCGQILLCGYSGNVNLCFKHILNGYFVHGCSLWTVMSCHAVMLCCVMFVTLCYVCYVMLCLLCYVKTTVDINWSYLIKNSLCYSDGLVLKFLKNGMLLTELPST